MGILTIILLGCIGMGVVFVLSVWLLWVIPGCGPRWLVGGMGLVSGLLTVGMLLGYRNLQKQFQKLIVTLDNLATGDLQQRIEHEFGPELAIIGARVNTMIGSLAHMIHTIDLQSETAKGITEALLNAKSSLDADSTTTLELSNRVVNENNQLDSETLQVKTGIEQVTLNMESIRAASTRLSDNVSAIAHSSEITSRNAEIMADTSDTMRSHLGDVETHLNSIDTTTHSVSQAFQDIRQGMQTITERCQQAETETSAAEQLSKDNAVRMDELAEAAAQIQSMVDVIDTIASQTNMLALNAAIEAAGAGDAGRGFAVVAGEVKELANQTATATNTISQLIQNIQKRAGDTLSSTQQLDQAIRIVSQFNGEILELIDQQNGSMETAVAAVTQVAHLSEEVTGQVDALAHSATAVAELARNTAGETATIAGSAQKIAQEACKVVDEILAAQESSQSVRDAVEKIFISSVDVQKLMLQSTDSMDHLKGVIQHAALLIESMAETSQALDSAKRGIQVENALFSIQEKKRFHLDWMQQLEQSRRGGEKPALTPKTCDFCRWMHTFQRSLNQPLPLMDEVIASHEHLHRLVDETLRPEFHAGDSDPLAPIHQQRRTLFKLLDQLYLVETGDRAKHLELVTWNSSLYLGIAQLDEDHRVLVEMINRIYHAIKTGQGQAQVNTILDGLIDYTATHFKREEVLFTQHDYPDRAEHLQKHAKLVNEVLQFRTQLQQGEEIVGLEILHFLRDWLINHIKGTDLRYAPYLRSRGVH
ncbi:MAG: bacteriohemerythrin [Magnetococcales bacterium]|nr:bacteriohemerythrin [Magnetococcales bacterium]